MRRFIPALAALLIAAAIAGIAYAQFTPCGAAACSYLPLVRLDPTPTLTPTPEPTATPQLTPIPPVPSVHVRSYRLVATSATSVHVYGEVENTTTKSAYSVKVIGKFYDASGAFVATDSTYMMLTKTDVGARNPFDLLLTNAPAEIVRVELSVTTGSTPFVAYVGATVLSQQTRDNFGLEVFGEVQNVSDQTINSVRVAVTFYDAAGNVYYTDHSYADVSSLAPNATSTYKVSTFEDNLADLSYTVQAQGYTFP